MTIRQTLLLTYTPRADVDLDTYHQWLRDVDNPFFNAQGVVHRYVNYRVVGPVLGQENFTHFDILEIEGDGGPDSIFGDGKISEFARDWVRRWGVDQDPDAPDQTVNYRVMLCEPVAQPS